MQGKSIYTQVANDVLGKHLRGEMKRNETFTLLQDNLAMSKVLKGDRTSPKIDKRVSERLYYDCIKRQ